MIMYSSCALAEYRGINGDAEKVLKLYTISRNKTSKVRIGFTGAHTHVILSFTSDSQCSAKDFCDLIRKKRFGTCVKSVSKPNINHNGWSVEGTRNVTVVVFTPNHKKLTKWYQKNFDKDYKLV